MATTATMPPFISTSITGCTEPMTMLARRSSFTSARLTWSNLRCS